MELLEALRPRKSIRAFKPEAVPQGLVTQVLEAARWARSWGNTQPWELLVVGGDPVKRLTAALAGAFEQKVSPNPDVPMPHKIVVGIALGYPDAVAPANA
jgi:nitroreductase